MPQSKPINKELLNTCAFMPTVYPTAAEAREFNQRLHLAMLLHRFDKRSEAKIVFNTIDGYRQVTAPVWGSTERHVLLKGGDSIPVESVAYVGLED